MAAGSRRWSNENDTSSSTISGALGDGANILPPLKSVANERCSCRGGSMNGMPWNGDFASVPEYPLVRFDAAERRGIDRFTLNGA